MISTVRHFDVYGVPPFDTFDVYVEPASDASLHSMLSTVHTMADIDRIIEGARGVLAGMA